MIAAAQGWLSGAPGSQLALLYTLGISVLTFVAFGWDKWKARRGWWRTPESTLLGLCLMGGWPAGAVAITLFRHKRSKQSFMRGFYGAAVANTAAVAAILWLRSAGG